MPPASDRRMWRVVVRTSIGDLTRRRTSLVLLLAIPFVVYRTSTSPGFLVLVAGWSIATLALFSWVFAHDIERRLAVVGARPHILFLGRGTALAGLGLLVALVGSGLIRYAEWDSARPWALIAALFAACAIGVPLGGVVGHLLPREMEGTLTLMMVLAVHFAVAGTAAGSWTRVLPLDGAMRLVDYAYATSGPGPSDALAAGLECLLSWGLLTAAAAMLAHRRLRPARLPHPGVAA